MISRPSQMGCIVAQNERGGLERLHGTDGKSRWKAYRFALRNGKPFVDEKRRSGSSKDVCAWFAKWLEDSITYDDAVRIEKEGKMDKETAKALGEVRDAILLLVEAVEGLNGDKKPKAATEKDIAEFAKTLDVLDVVNMPAKSCYARFVDWCRPKNIDPCVVDKYAKTVAAELGLTCDGGTFKKAK